MQVHSHSVLIEMAASSNCATFRRIYCVPAPWIMQMKVLLTKRGQRNFSKLIFRFKGPSSPQTTRCLMLTVPVTRYSSRERDSDIIFSFCLIVLKISHRHTQLPHLHYKCQIYARYKRYKTECASFKKTELVLNICLTLSGTQVIKLQVNV